LSGCTENVRDDRLTYVVKPQDTVYSIAWRYGLDFHDLARLNHIGPNFRISVGQTLVLKAGAAAPKKSAAPAQTAITQAPSSHAPISSALNWSWPTLRLAAPRPVPGGGILISGQLGQDIKAACAGRVVYTGSGIRGYGNLIIIKHGENLLSAYAHNRESLVQDGQEVGLGQVIAHMGEAAPQTPVLYFEIRKNGKPIDSLALLPPMK
jgi:lipoprotein NlpD